MESYGLEMEDLFDERDVSQDLDAFENDGGDNQVDNDGEAVGNENDGDISKQVEEKLRALGKGAAKKKVLRPQPKLDGARLTGDRGIPILPKLFANVKYKGKGHEASDLNTMMKTVEHWTHRLFPKMPFDEMIDRIEKLGQKREVQTVVNKIRLDMPVLSDDFVTQLDSDEENPERSINIADIEAAQIDNSAIMADDEEVLDELLSQEPNQSVNRPNVSITASTPYPKAKPTESTISGLTPDVLERIKRNQELARQKRLQRSTIEGAVIHTSQQHALNQSVISLGDQTAMNEEN